MCVHISGLSAHSLHTTVFITSFSNPGERNAFVVWKFLSSERYYTLEKRTNKFPVCLSTCQAAGKVFSLAAVSTASPYQCI